MLIIMYTNGYDSIPVMAGLKNEEKKIKISKKIKELDSFDYLVVFALKKNVTIRKNSKQIYTIGFNSIPVMAGLKKRKINQKIKKIKEFDSFD